MKIVIPYITLDKTFLNYIWFLFFTENIFGNFLETGQYISRSRKVEEIQPLNKNTYNMIMVDITTSFTILIGIFFPSVTGQYKRFSLKSVTLYYLCFSPRNNGRFQSIRRSSGRTKIHSHRYNIGYSKYVFGLLVSRLIVWRHRR